MTTFAVLLSITLAAAVLLGSLRLLATQRRAPAPRWRLLVRLLLQPLFALLLYFTLFPPLQPLADAPPLTVLTAGWQTVAAELPAGPARRMAGQDPPYAAAWSRTQPDTFALPEAGDGHGVPRSPDLASLLRQHPGRTVRVIGSGLAARDLDAARGRLQAFIAAPLPSGLIALERPARLQAGQRFTISGRTAGLVGGSASLLDPGGKPLARSTLNAEGRFQLVGDAPAAGPSLLSLQLSDGAGQAVERLPLPLVVQAPTPLRLMVLSAAPNPDTKYLRRWALDAGVELSSRVQLSPGIAQSRDGTALDAATLSALDALIIDDRSWHGLPRGTRATVQQAVRDGLGLLLRLTAEPTAGERAALRELGFEVASTDIARNVQLDPTATAPTTALAESMESATSPDGVTLQRRPLDVSADDSMPLLSNRNGEPLALWRPHGRGRIALWWLSDSFRLQLAAASRQHGQLWSRALSTLARARGAAPLRIDPPEPWRDQRITLCGLRSDARIGAADGSMTPLHSDPHRDCAGFWPANPGFHRIETDDAPATWLYVRDRDEAPALAAAQRRQATERLLATPPTDTDGAVAAAIPSSPWPWFIAWLGVLALLGGLERRRQR